MEKKYIIRCNYCRWAETTTGIDEDMKHLFEIKSCSHCGGRKFRCMKCGKIAKMQLIK